MTLDSQLDALRQVHELGADRVPDAQLASIEALLTRADGRRALSADHTVVGLFGATGSGKSSLLNAVVGEPIARSHVRRPTTSEPLAVMWDATGAAALLDWLEVRDRHTREEPIDPRAKQLILLDLPDFDSVQVEHRETAERLAGQVDALVWVVDPQKYADAVLHTDFIASHARHGAVTIVVLNQIDLLAAADVPRVVESLRGLLADDGLRGVRILPTSATTGEGIPELRTAIGALAEARQAQAARLSADVSAMAAAIPEPGVAGRLAKNDTKTRARVLTDQLGDAAGVDVVAKAVAGSYRKRSGQATGWPLVSWILRFRPDPLARLGLRPAKGAQRDPELHRSSMPSMNASAQAKVSLAVRSYADTVSAGLTEPWRAGIRDRGQGAIEALPNRLDLAITRAALPTKGSWWWVLFGIVQWIAVAAALAGVLWLLGIALLPMVPWPDVPKVEGWPLTTLLILGGVLLGVLLGIVGAALGAATASSRRRRARKSLLAQVALVAQDLVVAPLDSELTRAATFAKELQAARS